MQVSQSVSHQKRCCVSHKPGSSPPSEWKSYLFQCSVRMRNQWCWRRVLAGEPAWCRHLLGAPCTRMSCHKSQCNLVTKPWSCMGFLWVLRGTFHNNKRLQNSPKKGVMYKMEGQTESTHCRPLLPVPPPGRQTLTQTSVVAAA